MADEWPGLAATLAGFDDARLTDLLSLRRDLVSPAPRDWSTPGPARGPAPATPTGSWTGPPSAEFAARRLGTDAEEADSVAEAVAAALALAGEQELVHVTGSLYVVGAARAALHTS